MRPSAHIFKFALRVVYGQQSFSQMSQVGVLVARCQVSPLYWYCSGFPLVGLPAHCRFLEAQVCVLHIWGIFCKTQRIRFPCAISHFYYFPQRHICDVILSTAFLKSRKPMLFISSMHIIFCHKRITGRRHIRFDFRRWG